VLTVYDTVTPTSSKPGPAPARLTEDMRAKKTKKKGKGGQTSSSTGPRGVKASPFLGASTGKISFLTIRWSLIRPWAQMLRTGPWTLVFRRLRLCLQCSCSAAHVHLGNRVPLRQCIYLPCHASSASVSPSALPSSSFLTLYHLLTHALTHFQPGPTTQARCDLHGDGAPNKGSSGDRSSAATLLPV